MHFTSFSKFRGIPGAAGEKGFEQPDWEKIEALCSVFQDWNHQLKNSEFDAWMNEQMPLEHEEPQP